MASAYVGTGTLAGSIAGGIAGGFVGGMIASNGDFEAGLQGAFIGGLFGAVGYGGKTYEWNDLQFASAHAAVGCVSGELSGAGCGAGAASAAVGKFVTLQFTTAGLSQAAATVVAGGVSSVIVGGNFKDGALVSAFGYLFNELSDKSGRGPNERALIAEDRARANLEEEGYRFIGRQMVSSIDGLPDRRYDLVMISPVNKFASGCSKPCR